MSTELFTIIVHMQTSYEIKGWMLDLRLPDQAWLHERSHLSATLTDGQWQDIATAFMNVVVWNDLIQVWREADPLARWKPKAKLSDSDEEGMSAMRATLIQTWLGKQPRRSGLLALPSISDDDPLAAFFQRAKGTIRRSRNDERSTERPGPARQTGCLQTRDLSARVLLSSSYAALNFILVALLHHWTALRWTCLGLGVLGIV